MTFIDSHKSRDTGGLRWGVESICRVLTEHGIQIAPSTFYEMIKRPMSQRAHADKALEAEILRVYQDNYQVYGARKIWIQLNRDGIRVARCTVERLMKTLGIQGIRRGKHVRTTQPDPSCPRAADLINRDFNPLAPNRCWVADFTYVSTKSATVYVALVIDAYSRRILGWRAHTRMTTSLVLDALNHAIWARSREGTTDLTGLVHHNDAGSQYTSLAFTDRLALAGIAPSVGSVGDALDNALAESIMGLYKTELIHHHGPWKGLQDIEIATLEYIDWFNHRRLHRSCGDITPTELETAYYSKHIPPIKVGSTQH